MPPNDFDSIKVALGYSGQARVSKAPGRDHIDRVSSNYITSARFLRYLVALVVGTVGLGSRGLAQEDRPNPGSVLSTIVNKFKVSQSYSFEGEIEFAQKHGEDAREVIVSSRVKLTVAPGGRYLFSVGEPTQPEYLLVADGQSTWAYRPGQRKYMKLDPTAVTIPKVEDETLVKGVGQDGRDLFACSLLIIPILSQLDQNVILVEMTRYAEVIYKGEKQQLPVLTVLARGNTLESQTLTDLVVDPENAAVIRAEWHKTIMLNGEQQLAQLRVDFTRLEIDQQQSSSYFALSPDPAAERVEDLPIPGVDGSEMLNKPAPEFELEQANGPRIRLSALRGRIVVLAFAGGCGRCHQHLQALARIQDDYPGSALSIFVVRAATATDAAQPPAGERLAASLIDEAGEKVHRLYHVRFLPTIILINPQGEIVRILWGARGIDSLRGAVKEARL
jgi:peroxiredoxin